MTLIHGLPPPPPPLRPQLAFCSDEIFDDWPSIGDHMLESPKHYSSYIGGYPGLPPTTTEQTTRGVTGDRGAQQQVTDLDSKQDL